MVAHYGVIALLLVALFYVFYSTIILAFGPYINVSNWTFIIIAIVITPIAFYINHHFYNKDANTRVRERDRNIIQQNYIRCPTRQD